MQLGPVAQGRAPELRPDLPTCRPFSRLVRMRCAGCNAVILSANAKLVGDPAATTWARDGYCGHACWQKHSESGRADAQLEAQRRSLANKRRQESETGAAPATSPRAKSDLRALPERGALAWFNPTWWSTAVVAAFTLVSVVGDLRRVVAEAILDVSGAEENAGGYVGHLQHMNSVADVVGGIYIGTAIVWVVYLITGVLRARDSRHTTKTTFRV